MTPIYRNAFEVFPRELVLQLQAHYAGLVYVPKTEDYHKHRAELILSLRARKVSAREIAELSGISERRVYQIVARERKRAATEADKKISVETPEFSW